MTAIILPSRISDQDVLSRVDYFIDVQLWPLQSRLNPRYWLENFSKDEREYAVNLLNGFLYFSSDLINQIFRSAFQELSSWFFSPDDSFLSFQAKWREFVESVIVTYVTGETPNPTDSGFSFARKARQVLEIGQDKIMDPDEAIRRLMDKPGPVLFVDDFVGSGDQFIATWTRQVSVSADSHSISFDRLSSIRGTDFYYCPVICTEYGLGNLKNACPVVHVRPAHVLPWRYSVLSPDSIVWPDHMQAKAVEFVRNASLRAGIPDTGGNLDDWRGFHKLGLALALGDSVPDATLPIFYWEKNGWKPLIRRK